MGHLKAHEYQVKNTIDEMEIPVDESEVQYNRAAHRTLSDGDFDQAQTETHMTSKCEYMNAMTPSPLLHPFLAPTDPNMMMEILPPSSIAYEGSSDMPVAFGDLPVDFEPSAFDRSDMQANFDQALVYDPNSDMYLGYDWTLQSDPNCFDMMNGMSSMECNLGNDYEGMGYVATGEPGQAEQLLAALHEKIVADRDMDPSGMPTDCTDGASVIPEAYMNYGCVSVEGMEGHQAEDNLDAYGNTVEMQMQSREGATGASPRSRKSRNRERGDRGDRGERTGRGDGRPSVDNHASTSGPIEPIEAEARQHGPVNFTTVMLRNIPNKYTREMLVSQLEQDLKGHFDFVYLPIDFKNECNVGYAFINFTSVEACETFVISYNGVEVRKCLPGLNSRKVTEVTPARVQGFEDNVQRLRNSPVMRELAYHPEWMPLIFDANGVQQPFPSPERPLDPITCRPSRRTRIGMSSGS
jgi:hypothetical protein